jgi:anti-sigma-K factor RskA
VNVKEYISSGIVESYVLGMVTDAERKDFEAQSALYPEIAEARIAFEHALEERLVSDAKQPPQHLKNIVAEKISSNSFESKPDELIEKTPVRNVTGWKWLAAASLILLAGAAWWAFDTNKKYNDLRTTNSQLQNQLQQSTAQLDQMKKDADKLHDPGMKMAALKGTSQAPQAFATVYWDTASTGNVYLMINNLPQPPSDKQYQLWALLNGQPADLGVFDMDISKKPLLLQMQHVENAQAFAITLEPRGGSALPTMTSMYLTGSL